MSKMNVLHLIYSLHTGGAEKVIENYSKFHDRNFFKPIVCSITDGGIIVDEIKKTGTDVFLLNKKGMFDVSAVLRLARIIKSQNIHIVHVHNFSANFWGTITAVLCGVRFIVRTEHSIINKRKSLFRIKYFINSLLDIFQKKIICVSEEVRSVHVKRNTLSPKKYITIYNGVDSRIFNDSYETSKYFKEFNIEAGCKIVVKIASLTSHKGHEYFLRAAKKVLDEEKKVLFIIVGDGPRKDELTKLAKELGIKNSVVFTGVRKDINGILKLSDIFVLSSLREGFPITILEAMAASKPVIVTNVGGTPEAVIEGATGLIVQPKDEMAMAKAILLLLRDEKLRQIMGKKGRERFEINFKAESMVRKTEDVYRTFV
ncbi:MAG: glycosyltransferase [Candidatus Schekmanbacteria bacterium]|nr:glycosyltransferase [Candidatus Schekmanbacteria bacterium]